MVPLCTNQYLSLEPTICFFKLENIIFGLGELCPYLLDLIILPLDLPVQLVHQDLEQLALLLGVVQGPLQLLPLHLHLVLQLLLQLDQLKVSLFKLADRLCLVCGQGLDYNWIMFMTLCFDDVQMMRQL